MATLKGILANGTLLTTTTRLFNVHIEKSATIKSLNVTNNSGADRTVNIFAKKNSTSTRIIPKDVLLKDKEMLVLDNEIFLNKGESIEGDASGGNVDFIMTGEKEE